MTERPLFIDPVDVAGEGEVDDAPVPRWFTVVALLLLGIAAYYFGTFLGGPRASSPHNFDRGREVYERVSAP